MDDQKRRYEHSVITPFARGPRATTLLQNESSSLDADNHAVQAYLEMLRDESFISIDEFSRLEKAFRPLMKRYPYVRPAAIREVRNEMGRPENNKYVLRDKEETFWRNVRRKGEVPIPEFSPEEAVRLFHVTPDSDPNNTVVFLRPEYAKPISSYVPPSYRMGEVFFFVILRMFRRHLEKYER
jgi:hypothetical protein